MIAFLTLSGLGIAFIGLRRRENLTQTPLGIFERIEAELIDESSDEVRAMNEKILASIEFALMYLSDYSNQEVLNLHQSSLKKDKQQLLDELSFSISSLLKNDSPFDPGWGLKRELDKLGIDNDGHNLADSSQEGESFVETIDQFLDAFRIRRRKTVVFFQEEIKNVDGQIRSLKSVDHDNQSAIDLLGKLREKKDLLAKELKNFRTRTQVFIRVLKMLVDHAKLKA